jgi:hypothetical protein
MRNFSIVEPFKLDWRLAAPRDFETLELFITPQVSMVFHNITNGKTPFKIGAYLMEDPNKVKQFMVELMPQRSQARIEKAFKDEEVSAFFTLEDAKGLETLFEEEGFICRQIEVLYDGHPVSIPELPEAEFEKVIRTFAELRVVSTMDFQKQWEGIEEQIDDIREDVARGMRKRQAERDAKTVGMTKRTMTMRGALSAVLIGVSAVTAGISKRILSDTGWKKKVAGVALGLISAATGIAGKHLADNVMEHVRKGLVLNYG